MPGTRGRRCRSSTSCYGVDVAVPENRSMLEALRADGVEVMYDCLRGECGLCAVGVLEADCQMDHRSTITQPAGSSAG
ncbi:2Fe-2S iron-sulfur cluster-binding protein [Candidatus Solirubrobacter pratensis]|uniref:2Fe-2S iron-sulfur cluster-binding protein n=1 Tax=Candidatus Solirubrobacter pratensis TaxID=1298857 RepID=UPI000423C78C|nr:2Fe-2S iron-sulfur cluster binding domain-containing protein [Candidatus Solirubrobacter pratensis]